MSSRTITKVSVAFTISEWHEYLKSQFGATSTVTERMGYIRRFAKTCDTGPKPLMVCDIHAGHIATVFNSYGEEQHASRNQLLVAIRAYLRWCVRRRWIERDDAEDAIEDRKRVRYEPAPKYRMPEHMIPDALRVAGDSHPQRRAVIAMTLSTLARESELSFIRFSHLDLEERTVQLYRKKRKRWSVDRFDSYWFRELMDWLTWYAENQGYASAEAMVAAQPNWYLIPRLTAHGGWSPNAYKKIHPDKPYVRMEYVVKFVLDELGIETPGGSGDSRTHLREGMHTIRRSGARAFYKKLCKSSGRDHALLMVKAKLDHKDLKVTLSYIGVDDERDDLNEFLLEETMYDLAPPEARPTGENVLPFERRRNGDDGPLGVVV